MTPKSKVEWALRLAEAGFDIFPVHPDSKSPNGGYAWSLYMTRDPDTIRRWFDERPEMNYGVHPGEDHVVIDLDVKPGKNGVEFLRGLEADIAPDEWVSANTFMVHTPSGGYHLYLSTPYAVSLAHKFPRDAGIDVRGYHGYVVGPGSTIGDRWYEVVDDGEIAGAPEWLLDYLKRPGEKDPLRDDPIVEWDLEWNVRKAEEFLRRQDPAIQYSGGNPHTYETAAMVRDIGISEAKCVELLCSSGWNDRCDPPWGYDELEAVVEHAYRYAQNRAGCEADLMSMYLHSHLSVELLEQMTSGPAPVVPSDHLYNRSQARALGRKRDYIIPEWLLGHGFTALNAARSTGKSTILIDLACRIACGMDWWGLPIKQGYKVVYMCGEDFEGLQFNMDAWEQHHGVTIPDDTMLVSDEIARLMSPESVDEWITAIKKRIDGAPTILILDTWQRASYTGGQNRDEDMQRCVDHVELLAKSLRAPVIVAAHPPKDGRHTILGSSIIENSTTAIWHLADTPAGKKLTVTRIKGPGEGNYRLFQFEEREMDEVDTWGNREKGLVAVKVGGTEEDNKAAERKIEDEKREAWGRIVMLVMSTNEAIANPDERAIKNNQYTINSVGLAVEQFRDHGRGKQFDDFRSKLSEHLKSLEKGASDLKHSAIINRLNQIFVEFPGPCWLRDINKEMVISKKKKFKIQDGPAPREEEDPKS